MGQAARNYYLALGVDQIRLHSQTKFMENSQERLVRYLQDAHAAEVGVAKMLEDSIEDTEDVAIKALFAEHLTMTHTHQEQIAQCLANYDEKPNGGKSLISAMMSKVSDLIQGAHDQPDKNTQYLIKAFAAENLERGIYESLIAYAQAIGKEDVAQVARNIQQQEQQTAERIWPMISQYAVTALEKVSDRPVAGATTA